MSENYTADDIKVLDELTHIRKNSSMYMGSTETPTHLLEECLDNALDECFDGYAKIVAININTISKTYCVLDSGRGIPYEKDTPVIISTKLFSGSKFKGDKKAYKICTGKHGVGIVIANALSKKYSIEIYRDKHAIFDFENGELKSKKIEDFEGEKPFSTKICFTPDKKYFESLDIDIERIRRRLLAASVELPDVHLVLIIDKKKEVIKLKKEEFFRKEVLTSADTETSKIIEIKSKDKIEEFDIMFAYSYTGATTARIFSAVNLLPVYEGGTHISVMNDFLKEYFGSLQKRNNVKFQPSDVLCGLRAYVTLDIIDPEFASQSKEKLSVKKDMIEKFLPKLRISLDAHFKANSEELTQILTFFNDYRLKQESKNLKSKNETKRLSTKFTKLRDCQDRNGELFIVEGDSAAGSLIQCRDPKKHAVLPLKGKVLNVVSKKDIFKNVEVNEIIQSLGTGVAGAHFDISKMRYSKIIIAVDPDEDGKHIACLLMMMLSVLVPEVVKKGFLYMSAIPLYSIIKKDELYPLWTAEEVETAKKENVHLLRAKGLGQLNPQQLKVFLTDDKTRKLIKIEFCKDLTKMSKLFSDSNEKRKLLEGVWI